VPGAGKTWLAQRLMEAVNETLGRVTAAAVSMDGFHLTKDQLRAMPVSGLIAIYTL
jgi:pantothenate kinase